MFYIDHKLSPHPSPPYLCLVPESVVSASFPENLLVQWNHIRWLFLLISVLGKSLGEVMLPILEHNPSYIFLEPDCIIFVNIHKSRRCKALHSSPQEFHLILLLRSSLLLQSRDLTNLLVKFFLDIDPISPLNACLLKLTNLFPSPSTP